MPGPPCITPAGISGHASAFGSTAPSRATSSGGFAKPLPHPHHSGKRARDSIGQACMSPDTTQQAATNALPGSNHSIGKDVRVPSASESRKASAGNEVQEVEWRHVRSLLVPRDQQQHDAHDQAASTPAQKPSAGAAASDAEHVSMGHANAVDAPIEAEDAEGPGVGTAGSGRCQAGKPENRKGSWSRMWTCCGSRNMAHA